MMLILQIHSCSSSEQKLAHSYIQSFLSRETSYLPQEDYKEIIELCPLIWGFTLPSHTAKKQSISLQTARCLSFGKGSGKGDTYIASSFMIRNEFKLIAVERRNLSEFCICAAHIYIPACIACLVARRSDAPVSDLMLIREIKEYTNMRTSAPSLEPQHGVVEPSPMLETHLKCE